MQRLTSKPWFGPKRWLGWGWTPTAWQGWAVVVVFAVLAVASGLAFSGAGVVAAIVVLIALLIGVCVITGDPPG